MSFSIHDVVNINFSKRFRIGRIVEKYKPNINPEEILRMPTDDERQQLDISSIPPDYFQRLHTEMMNQKIVGYINSVKLDSNRDFIITILWEDLTITEISWWDDISKLDEIRFYEKFVKLDAHDVIKYITQFAIRKQLNRAEPLPYHKELIKKKKKVIITKKMKEKKRQIRLERRALKKAGKITDSE